MGGCGAGHSLAVTLQAFEAQHDGRGPGRTSPVPMPRPSPEAVERVRQHPYVGWPSPARLGALGGTAHLAVRGPARPAGARRRRRRLDRVGARDGAGRLRGHAPEPVLSPIAGTFVDRWDHEEAMVISDILRAAIMFVIPITAVTNIVLVAR